MSIELARQLKELRESKRYTLGQVAYAVDEPVHEIMLWESGKGKPSAAAKRKLEFLYSQIGDIHKELEKINEDNYSEFFNYPGCVTVPVSFPLWLKAHGFFIAPASLGHHGNQCGGLFIHSLKVAKELKRYTHSLGLQWQNDDSPWIVGMFHDICKTDDYAFNWNEGKWEWNKQQIYSGHGDKSVIMLQQHLTLNEQEIACIRWHMGSFTDQKEWEYYGRAVEKYPVVLFTHTADMYASRALGV